MTTMIDFEKIVEQANEALLSKQTMKIDPAIVIELVCRLSRFKVIGTDGCRKCETGRVAIWKNYDRCLECQKVRVPCGSTKGEE